MNALVLAGGRSERMGMDKGNIKWHGVEQKLYLAELLESIGCNPFISCRHDQSQLIPKKYRVLIDQHKDAGPYGAVLTAFEFDASSPWLVLACDLPYIDEATISFLLYNNDRTKVATAYIYPADGLPEPMISIWQPHSYDILLNGGSNSLRYILRTHDVKLLSPPNELALTNVNTPEEFEKAWTILSQSKQ